MFFLYVFSVLKEPPSFSENVYTEPPRVISSVIKMRTAFISDCTVILLNTWKSAINNLHLTWCRAHLNRIVKPCHTLLNYRNHIFQYAFWNLGEVNRVIVFFTQPSILRGGLFESGHSEQLVSGYSVYIITVQERIPH